MEFDEFHHYKNNNEDTYQLHQQQPDAALSALEALQETQLIHERNLLKLQTESIELNKQLEDARKQQCVALEACLEAEEMMIHIQRQTLHIHMKRSELLTRLDMAQDELKACVKRRNETKMKQEHLLQQFKDVVAQVPELCFVDQQPNTTNGEQLVTTPSTIILSFNHVSNTINNEEILQLTNKRQKLEHVVKLMNQAKSEMMEATSLDSELKSQLTTIQTENGNVETKRNRLQQQILSVNRSQQNHSNNNNKR
jgi:hypothetical protein